jgi:hypothetical protein
MKRLLAALTVPVLSLSLLAGCGGDAEDTAGDDASTGAESPDADPSPSAEPSEEGDGQAGDLPSEGAVTTDPDAPGADSKYCELLGTDFASLFASIQGPEDVTAAVDVIEQIADEAPAAVRDEWAVMEGALGTMQGALTRAAELQKQAAEGKVSQKKLQKETAQLMQDMQALDTPENNQAGEAVAKHATEYCGITLG